RHPTSPLFPYTTLFRSRAAADRGAVGSPRGRSPAFHRSSISRKGAASAPPYSGASSAGQAKSAPLVLSIAAGASARAVLAPGSRSEEHTSELQSRSDLV